jgi:hypothetical protein
MRTLIGTLLFFSVSIDAAEIYRCRMAQGGEFWSSAVCSKSGGYMVDAVQVPTNMSWNEQVRFAEQRSSNQQSARNSEEQEFSKRNQCASIDAELKQIFSAYERGQHVPVERVGPDQIRTRELRAQRSQLQCQSR